LLCFALLRRVRDPGEMIKNLDGRSVIVATAGGQRVSIGRVKVSAIDERSQTSFVSITFETETMRCELGVPSAKLDALCRSDDGEYLRYSLPPGDAVWLPRPLPLPPASGEPVIETFALPEAPAALPVPAVPTTPVRKNPRKLTIADTRNALNRLLRNVNSPGGDANGK
jgi:hypothetical protein